MTDTVSFPGYIRRDEEEEILLELALVKEDRGSRVVLLYGPGGVGKTSLVRELKLTSASDDTTSWLEPIDVDDSEYWLLSNLERRIAEQLDPERLYFGRYLDYLSRLPQYTRPRIGHETVLSHLGRIKKEFVECYGNFITGSGRTVVLTLDTVEAIRSMYLLLTLTQWMKALPGTLFILTGRPPGAGIHHDDPIRSQLEDPHQSLPVRSVHLAEFDHAAALRFLDESAMASALEADEKEKLVHLSRGHPLWLTLTVDYLAQVGMPEEVDRNTLAEVRRQVPYRGESTPEGRSLHEAFKRRLVTPYRNTDFWHEAIKRLAVVRHSVSEPIWRELMSDRALPADAGTWERAWDVLLGTPWVRPRANHRYVTLHDALAEELAQRIIPLHDQDEAWRRGLWRRAVRIYSELTERPGQELEQRLATLDESLQEAAGADAAAALGGPAEGALMDEVARLDAEKRELDQLRTARLYYRLLSDFEDGGREFLALYERAAKQHDLLFQELISNEIQRFLPSDVGAEPLGDVVRAVVAEFRRWLTTARPGLHVEIGLSIADHLIQSEQPELAMELLESLPESVASSDHRYRLSIQRGNACIRIAHRVREARDYFEQAYDHAIDFDAPDRERRQAQALKELGFYYRNIGEWPAADRAYRRARDVILTILSPRSAHEDREEMASIQTNWAYVNALRGNYQDAQNLVESAISVRRQLKETHGVGVSLSVYGELYRYDRKFRKAWAAYEEAEGIFQELRNWPWLGLLYQEKAICLFQAALEEIELVPSPLSRARELSRLALDLCRDQAVRGYPSALNRAGRIFGHENLQDGLRFLEEGIDEARKVADGWFLLANLIEYVELNYRAWLESDRIEYRARIVDRALEIEQAVATYDFPDLQGRWRLLQGHLGVQDVLATGEQSGLSDALEHYKVGFALIAKGYIGSHGIAAIPSEFEKFRRLFQELPAEVRDTWYEELRRAWSAPECVEQSTSLLARLEELY